jgi:hypothetical protein
MPMGELLKYLEALRLKMRIEASMKHHGMASVSIDGKRRTMLVMFTIKEEDNELINWDLQP